MKLKIKCSICGLICKDNRGLARHIKTHNYTSQSYYDMFLLKNNENKCKRCGKPTLFYRLGAGYHKFCSNVCSSNYIETRIKCKNTVKRIYGVDNIAENHDILLKKRKKYLYDKLNFDSGWEIIYYIWLKDHNIDFEYHPCLLTYKFNDKEYKYEPDFKIGNEIIEIKNDALYKQMLIEHTKENAKLQCIKENNIKIMLYNDMKPYIEYIENKTKMKYKNFIKQYKK